MEILTISDLHVGEATRALDLVVGDRSRAIFPNFMVDFRALIDAQNITPDLLIVSGDITNRATWEEFRHASEVLRRIAQILRIGEDRIVFCPGNHDKNWGQLESARGAPPADQLRLAYEPLLANELVFNAALSHANGSFSRAPYIVKWEFDRAVVIAFNSSVRDGPNQNPHHGSIEHNELHALQETFRQLPNDDRYRIFLTHHHVHGWMSPTPGYTDFSMMTNAEGLMNVLWRHRVDLVVHGHRHCPRITQLAGPHNHPVVILCSGSFSGELPIEWNGLVLNQFSTVTFEGRARNTGNVIGRVRSWSYNMAQKWTPSRLDTSGIRHDNPFGSLASMRAVQNALKPLIEAELTRTGHAFLSTLCASTNALRFAFPEFLADALTELRTDGGFEMMETSNGDVVILKG